MGGSLPLPLHSYQLRSRNASSARIVNALIEPLPQGARAKYGLVRTPGVADWTTVGAGPIHAQHEALGYLWVVSGDSLYRVSEAKVVTLIGVVGHGTRIDIDSDSTTVVVTTGFNGYYYDTTTATFGQITDVDFTARGAGDVEFLSNFMLFREPNSGRFFCANVGEATVFDGLKFTTAEASPDNLNGLIVDHLEAVLAGTKTLEIWELVGGAGFPFARVSNGTIELGCANGATLAKLDNSVFWLASDLTVRRLDGTTPARVSHAGIEQAIAEATISSAYAFSYTQEGHLFYVLTFNEGTFVYDATIKDWAERQSYGLTNWRVSSYAYFAGKHLVGDRTSNKIGYLSPLVYQEWGGILRMEWTYQPVYANNDRVFHDRLEIVCQTGAGLPNDGDPQMMMACSDDGGLTFEELPTRSMGKVGQYNATIAWQQLGSSPQRVYRGSVSDAVPVCITDTQLTARGARPFGRAA